MKKYPNIMKRNIPKGIHFLKPKVKMKILMNDDLMESDNVFQTTFEYIRSKFGLVLFIIIAIIVICLLLLANMGSVSSNMPITIPLIGTFFLSGHHVMILMACMIVLLEPVIGTLKSTISNRLNIISLIQSDGINIKSDDKKRGSIFIESSNILDIVLYSFLSGGRNYYKIILICKTPIFVKFSKRYKKEIVLFKFCEQVLATEDIISLCENGLKYAVTELKEILKVKI